MVGDSLPLNLVRVQIPAIQSLINKQMQAYQALLLLSCEMFIKLYEKELDFALSQRWHEIIKDLM